MSQVIQFPQRKQQDIRPMATGSDVRPRGLQQDVRPMPAPAGNAPQMMMVNVADVGGAGAAMQVLAALAFYARSGWDGGKKAQIALMAMKEEADPGPQLA